VRPAVSGWGYRRLARSMRVPPIAVHPSGRPWMMRGLIEVKAKSLVSRRQVLLALGAELVTADAVRLSRGEEITSSGAKDSLFGHKYLQVKLMIVQLWLVGGDVRCSSDRQSSNSRKPRGQICSGLDSASGIPSSRNFSAGNQSRLALGRLDRVSQVNQVAPVSRRCHACCMSLRRSYMVHSRCSSRIPRRQFVGAIGNRVHRRSLADPVEVVETKPAFITALIRFCRFCFPLAAP